MLPDTPREASVIIGSVLEVFYASWLYAAITVAGLLSWHCQKPERRSQ